MGLLIRAIRWSVTIVIFCCLWSRTAGAGVFVPDPTDMVHTKDRLVATFEYLLEKNDLPIVLQSRELADILKWARANHRLEHCIHWLTFRVEENPHSLYLRMAMADCLLLNRDWKSLASSLQNEQWHYQDHIRLIYIANAKRELGESDWADFWQESKENASGNSEKLKSIMALISQWPAWKDDAEAMLWSQINNNTMLKVWSSKRLGHFYLNLEDPKGLARFNRYLLDLHPDNPDLINNEVVYAILDNRHDSVEPSLIESLKQARMVKLDYRLTYALYLFVSGEQSAAYEEILDLPREWMELPQHALYCAVISAPFAPEWSRKLHSIGSEGDYMTFEKQFLLRLLD